MKKGGIIIIVAVAAILLGGIVGAITIDNGQGENIDDIYDITTFDPFDLIDENIEIDILESLMDRDETKFVSEISDVTVLIYPHSYSTGGPLNPQAIEWIIIKSATNSEDTRTAVFRLEHESKEVIESYKDNTSEISEEEALMRIEDQIREHKESGIGENEINENDIQRIGVNYIYNYPAHDFGGTIIVNAYTGETVFHGTTVWAGVGELIEPEIREIIIDPDPIEYIKEVDIFDPYGLIEENAEDSILEYIITSEEFEILSELGQIEVLIYPHSYSTGGPLNPSNAEWIIIMKSGVNEEFRVALTRLDYETEELIEYYMEDYADLSEVSREEVIDRMEEQIEMQDYVNIPGDGLCGEVEEKGSYLIYQYPASDFGCTVIASQTTGEVIFHGTIVWNGTGELILPEDSEIKSM